MGKVPLYEDVIHFEAPVLASIKVDVQRMQGLSPKIFCDRRSAYRGIRYLAPKKRPPPLSLCTLGIGLRCGPRGWSSFL